LLLHSYVFFSELIYHSPMEYSFDYEKIASAYEQHRKNVSEVKLRIHIHYDDVVVS
jgi:hypothetical protein